MVLLALVSSTRLPHADLSHVPVAKLRDYVLNADHPQGGPKARVFAAVLGMARDDWPELRRQLLTGVMSAPATLRATTQWGHIYEVIVPVTGTNGRTHSVRTGWIVRAGDKRPHLTTAYVDLS